jgi:hypothetical protein
VCTLCFDVSAVQKQPEMPSVVMCGRDRECSIMKSSINDPLLAQDLSGLIFGELTVRVCDTGLDESRPLIRLVARPFLASHFLSIVIALSKGFVACLNGARLAQSPDCRRREGEVACYFNSIQRVNSSSMPNTQSSFRTWAHEYFSFRRVAADQPGVSALLMLHAVSKSVAAPVPAEVQIR